MEKLFIPYMLAAQLKHKGFDDPCMAKWMLDMTGDSVPHFRYNYESEGLWFKHNSKDTSELNGNQGKDFLWSAPMYQQIINWFMEHHKIQIDVYPDQNDAIDNEWRWRLQPLSNQVKKMLNGIGNSKLIMYYTYNDALNIAIEEALKLI